MKGLHVTALVLLTCGFCKEVVLLEDLASCTG